MTDLVFERKDVFSWSNAEDAESYIGKEGYFTDYFDSNLTKWSTGVLKDVYQDNPIAAIFNNGTFKFGLFLPADKVKGENKWRPFTLDEFNKIFKIGHVIIFRSKDSDYHGTWLYTGWATGSNLSDRELVHLGTHLLGLQELFDNYEYSDVVRGWCPFGVEVEE